MRTAREILSSYADQVEIFNSALDGQRQLERELTTQAFEHYANLARARVDQNVRAVAWYREQGVKLDTLIGGIIQGEE